MIVGDKSIFALESKITKAFASLSLRGLGFLVIHVLGQRYGINSPDATMLANSLGGVEGRILARGKHMALFDRADATEIADAFTNAIYIDDDETKTYLGLTVAQFTEIVNSNWLMWAPDGDEAFDDGSYVLQLDVGDQVRLIAFSRPDSSVDPASVRDVWLPADDFYGLLQQWREGFLAKWESMPKE
jgi:immunity protein 42 of polymorphic toxin system